MKLRNFKIGICVVFMMIFLSKMVISLSPAFLCFNSKTINAVIMQLELEGKNEKEDPDKDAAKEKKFFDENVSYTCQQEHLIHIIDTSVLHNQEQGIYKQVYHASVPTPPPDAITV